MQNWIRLDRNRLDRKAIFIKIWKTGTEPKATGQISIRLVYITTFKYKEQRQNGYLEMLLYTITLLIFNKEKYFNNI